MSSAAIVLGIRGTTEGPRTVRTKKIGDHVYVVKLGRGAGLPSKLPTVYLPPNGSVKIKIPIPDDRGFVDGQYDVEVRYTGVPKECIAKLTVFGADITGKGVYTLHVYSQPYVEIKAKGSGCEPRPGTITVKITSKLTKTPLVFHIPVKPLKVKFPRLVQALTCPDFKLDDLREEVKRSVLAAALGSDDPCTKRNDIGGEKGEASGQVGNYYWTVTDNTFCAKSSSDATDCAFEIKFDSGEPAVWVEKASEGEVKEALDKALEIKNRSYVLTVKIADPKTGWYVEYGQTSEAKIKALANAAMSPGTIATYTAACVATTILCEGIKVSLGNPIGIIKAVAYEAPGCALGAVFSGLAFKASANNLSYLAANPAGWLSYIGTEYVKLQGIRTGAAGYSRIYGGLVFRGSPFSTMKKIYTLSDAFRTNKASDIGKALGELAETLQSSPSTIPGVSYSNVRVSTLIGIPSSTAKDLASAIDEIPELEKYLTEDEITALKNVLLKASDNKTKISAVSPEDLKKFGKALEELKAKGFFTEDILKKYPEARKLKTAYEDVVDNLSHPQTLVEKIGKEAGEEASLRKSFFCGALGNIAGSITAYASLYYGPLKGFNEIFLNVCSAYPDRQVQITVNSAPTNETWTIFVGTCNWGAPESSNIPSINTNVG